MELSKYRKNIGKIASALGVLQAVAWTFLTLLAIIIHYWQPEIGPPTSYTRTIEVWLYYKFLVDDGTLSDVTFIFTPGRFVIVMWIYFVINVLWGTLSVDLFSAIHSNKKRRFIVMKLWGVDTLFLSFLDTAFVVLLGIDYAACGGDTVRSGVTETQYFCYTSIGIVMAIAARGFTLLLVNVILSIVLLHEATDAQKEEDTDESLYSTIPRARLMNKIFPYYLGSNTSNN